MDRNPPVGITDISLKFEIDSNAEPNKNAPMVEMAERYCVIAQTLTHPLKITVSHTQNAG